MRANALRAEPSQGICACTHKHLSYTKTHTHTHTTTRLWTAGRGQIVRPPSGETFFLPQRPYCTLGTLREQLLYPQRPGSDLSHVLSDDELLEILRKVRLYICVCLYIYIYIYILTCRSKLLLGFITIQKRVRHPEWRIYTHVRKYIHT